MTLALEYECPNPIPLSPLDTCAGHSLLVPVCPLLGPWIPFPSEKLFSPSQEICQACHPGQTQHQPAGGQVPI